MAFALFSRQAPLDEPSVTWIFEVFDWALRHLGSEVFYRDTILVTPGNKHFPGRANNVSELATLMFERSRQYAGMQQWPLRLVPPGTALPAQMPRIEAPPALRQPASAAAQLPQALPAGDAEASIPIGYNPKQVNSPEAMIAGFAQVMAHYLGSEVKAEPPGGIKNWPQTTEVLGVFLGFGVLFANTAFTHKTRSCSSCGPAPVDRQVNLSQYDVTYALALFCVLKGIPNREALRTLKGSLRGYFKRCRRDIESRTELLRQLPAPTMNGVSA